MHFVMPLRIYVEEYVPAQLAQYVSHSFSRLGHSYG